MAFVAQSHSHSGSTDHRIHGYLGAIVVAHCMFDERSHCADTIHHELIVDACFFVMLEYGAMEERVEEE